MRIQFGLVALTIILGACDYNTTEDYNPKSDFKEYLAAKEAHREALAKDAKPVDPEVLARETAKKTFGLYCSSCHGADGAGNTPTALALNPRPRNLTDVNWQDSVDDAVIAKVIKEGGASIGLSPTMAPWGATLNDEEIKHLAKYIRTLKK